MSDPDYEERQRMKREQRFAAEQHQDEQQARDRCAEQAGYMLSRAVIAFLSGDAYLVTHDSSGTVTGRIQFILPKKLPGPGDTP